MKQGPSNKGSSNRASEALDLPRFVIYRHGRFVLFLCRPRPGGCLYKVLTTGK